MDKNTQKTIDSLKSVIATTQKQLEQMSRESNPNLKLMAAVKDNHDRAISILQLLKDIPEVKSASTTTQFTTMTEEEQKPINITRDTSQPFQVIPPKRHQEHPQVQHHIQKAHFGSENQAQQSEPRMTRAEYREMLKKHRK